MGADPPALPGSVAAMATDTTDTTTSTGDRPADTTTPSGEDGDARTGRYVEERYERDTRYLDDRVTTDARDGWPVEPGRYRLIVSRACPWANRAIIVRRLLGLEAALPMGVAGPTHDADSWTFDLDPGGVDPVLGIPRLKDAFEARRPGYELGITVPAIVDVPSGQVVTNDFKQITLDLSTEWTVHHRDGAPDLYPERLRDEIDAVVERVYRDVNNGVYEAGFAGTQAAYEEAYQRLFARLDWLSERLQGQRYLVGDTITEADVRLFTTLARFDAVYHGHFKCNRSKLTELPVLWAYARDLFQTPGFGDTIDFVHIKRHYYEVHRDINPTGVVPAGPDLSGWATAHGREGLGGRPFGDGTPPGPVPADERVPSEHNPLLGPSGEVVLRPA
jgi:glutathionyl-hydroquinone reductase